MISGGRGIKTKKKKPHSCDFFPFNFFKMMTAHLNNGFLPQHYFTSSYLKKPHGSVSCVTAKWHFWYSTSEYLDLREFANLFPGVIPSVGFELRNALLCFLWWFLQDPLLCAQRWKLRLLNAEADNNCIYMAGCKTGTLPSPILCLIFQGCLKPNKKSMFPLSSWWKASLQPLRGNYCGSSQP